MTSHDWRSNPDDEELQRLAAVYIDRLIAGEEIEPVEIIANHPECGERILEEIETFTRIGGSTNTAPLSTLGDYTLRRQIGRGGMGVVYEAWQGTLDRQVALKVLPAGIAADDKAFLRFMREAKSAAKLNHQNIVSVYGMGVEQNTPYYSMEFIEGKTLAQVLAKIKDAEPKTETPFGKKDDTRYFANFAEAFADVSEGLQHAHSKGVVHRDIKPSNLILDSDGRLRILDFGLAHLEGQESLTLSSDVVGTPLYMSPEQARRKKIPVDHRTDVYSLGATMYETLCGRPPFWGKDYADTLSQIIEREPAEPRKANTRVPKDLETIVLKCLRKNAGDRYGTAEALGQDLRRFVRAEPIEAKQRSRVERWTGYIRVHRVASTMTSLVFLLAITTSWILVSLHRQYTQALEAEYKRHVLAAASKLASAESPFVGSGSIDLLHEARVDLESAIKLLPRKRDAQFHLAKVLIGLSQNSGARELLAPMAADFYPAAYLLGTIPQSFAGAPQEQTFAAPREPRGWEADWQVTSYQLSQINKGQVFPAAFRLMRRYSPDSQDSPYIGISLEVRLAYARAFAAGTLPLNLNAFEAFARVHERWPDLVEPAVFSGILAYRLSAENLGESRLERIYEENQRSDYVAALISRACLIGGPRSVGLQWAERIRDEPLRTTLRALLLAYIGRFDDARPLAKEAVELSPDSSEALSALAMVQHADGDLEAATSAIFSAVQRAPRSREFMRQLTNYLAESRDPVKAMRMFDELIATHGKTPLILLYLARFRGFVMSDYAGAVEHLTVLSQFPEYEVDAYFYRSQMLGDLGSVREAIDDVSHAIELAPALIEGYANRSVLRIAIDDYEGALKDIETALRGRKDPGFYNGRGIVLAALGRYEEALSDFDHAVEELENKSWKGLALLNRAGTKTELRDFEGALEDCDRYFKQCSDPWIGALYRSRALAHLGKRDEALQSLSVALERIPESIPSSREGNRWVQVAEVHAILASQRHSDSVSNPSDSESAQLEAEAESHEAKALEFLEKAVDCGYQRVRELESSRDFERIRNHSRFHVLLKRIVESASSDSFGSDDG